jgi:hypothetical protein
MNQINLPQSRPPRLSQASVIAAEVHMNNAVWDIFFDTHTTIYVR